MAARPANGQATSRARRGAAIKGAAHTTSTLLCTTTLCRPMGQAKLLNEFNTVRWLIRVRGRERVPTLVHARRAQWSPSLSLYDLRALLPAPALRPYTNKTKTPSPSAALSLLHYFNAVSGLINALFLIHIVFITYEYMPRQWYYMYSVNKYVCKTSFTG